MGTVSSSSSCGSPVSSTVYGGGASCVGGGMAVDVLDDGGQYGGGCGGGCDGIRREME